MVYIEELILVGFESHEYTVIRPSTGLNIIVGETSHGKSSILRALKLVYTNHLKGAALESSININADEFRIIVKLSNGYTVVREKNRKTINRYILIDPNGEETKLGKFTDAAVPVEIQKVLGITKRRFEPKNEINFNFLDQIKSSFLVEDTGSKKSKVIGMIRETQYMDQAVREVNKDIRANETQVKEVKQRIEKVDENLQQYEYLDRMGELLKEVDKLMKTEADLAQNIEKLTLLSKDYAQNTEAIKAVKEEKSELKALLGETVAKEVKSLEMSEFDAVELIGRIEDIEKKLVSVNEYMKKSKDAAADIKAATGIDKKISELNQLSGLNEDLLSANKRAGQYRSVMKDLEGLISISAEFLKSSRGLEVMKDVAGLVDCDTEIAKKMKLNDVNMSEASKQVDSLLTEYREILEDMGTCPVCRQQLDKKYVGNIVEGLRVK